MDKRIILGIVSGLILGGIEMMLLNGSYEFLIIAAIVGGLIGFASTKVNKVATYFIASVLIGAALYLIIAMFSGRTELMLDDAVTGAVTGLLIGLIAHFVGPKLISA